MPEDADRAKAIVFESELFDIIHGILYHFQRPRSKRQSAELGEVAQVVLPKADRPAAMRAFHNDNGHFGVKKTTALIKSKYCRHRMFKDITEFVKSCDRCQRAKRDTTSTPLPLHPLPVTGVFGRLHMEIIGPVCKSTEGHEYILVVVDSFSRWIEAWPLKTQTAAEIARLLHDEIFCRYGAAIEIISDKGRNFLSKLVNAVCEIYQVTRHSTASYRPQSNGCVERQNASITQTIRMYVDRSQRNWPSFLPVALMALRSTPNLETSGFSPFQMLFGCKMRVPFDTQLIPRDNLGPEAKVHVEQLLNRLKLSHEIAKENSKRAKERDKNRHDLKAKESNFLPGQQVLLKVQKVPNPLSTKLHDKYDGPYYIREKCQNDTYRIVHSHTHKPHPNKVNATHLRRYFDPEDYQAFPEEYPQGGQPTPDAQPPGPRTPEPTDTSLPGHKLPERQKTTEEQAPVPVETDIIVDRKPGNEGNPKEEPHVLKGKTSEPTPDQPPGWDESTQLSGNCQETTASNPKHQDIESSNSEPKSNEVWYKAVKLLKMKKQEGKPWFLVKWVGNHAPSWEPEENCSPYLKQQYYITHTKQGKKRRRKYRFFNKSN